MQGGFAPSSLLTFIHLSVPSRFAREALRGEAMMILPSDTQEQQDLYEKLMKASNLNTVGTIKGAGLNLLLAVILKTSSSNDEAVLQWNELSTIVENLIEKHYSSRDSIPDNFASSEVKFNGG